jgi:hypothetical protein
MVSIYIGLERKMLQISFDNSGNGSAPARAPDVTNH